MFYFVINFKNDDFVFKIEKNSTILQDLDAIIAMEDKLKEKMAEFSINYHYLSRYQSIDMTKKSIISDIDNNNDNYNNDDLLVSRKEKTELFQYNEDIVEMFEEQYNNYIENNKMLKEYNKIQFFLRDYNNKRFCAFCLHKKVLKF
jgi:hypothetical protein